MTVLKHETGSVLVTHDRNEISIISNKQKFKAELALELPQAPQSVFKLKDYVVAIFNQTPVWFSASHNFAPVEAPAEMLITSEEVIHLFESKDRIVQVMSHKAVIVNLLSKYQVEIPF